MILHNALYFRHLLLNSQRRDKPGQSPLHNLFINTSFRKKFIIFKTYIYITSAELIDHFTRRQTQNIIIPRKSFQFTTEARWQMPQLCSGFWLKDECANFHVKIATSKRPHVLHICWLDDSLNNVPVLVVYIIHFAQKLSTRCGDDFNYYSKQQRYF